MARQITTTALALLLSTLTMLSTNAFAADATSNSSQPEKGITTTEGYVRPLEVKARGSTNKTTLTSRHNAARQFDIFYIDAWLFNDDDYDGFYSSFDLSFDLDVDYGSAAVFADIWIRPQNGYYELLHTSDVFIIEGYGTHDEYHVSTDLIDDFPVGYYDILIELYDVEYSQSTPVASANSHSFDALFALPLESRNRYDDYASVGVRINASTGSFWFLLLPLGTLLALRLRKSL